VAGFKDFEIIHKQQLAENIKLFEIFSENIAKKALPGQFVILRITETGERIPLTIADIDTSKCTITIVFQEVGKSTSMLGKFEVGEKILDFIGPLGNPSEIKYFGSVVCVGGGVGIAPIYPIAKALKAKGNKIISIIGARSKNLLFWEAKMCSISDELIVTTDDGSYGVKGVVTQPLKEILEREKVDMVLTIGPPIMMKYTALTTKLFNVKTIASLNPIMVDGTGMCGACRVEVGGKTKFSCVDGPEFDAHEVNFELLMNRLKTYLEEEKISFENIC